MGKYYEVVVEEIIGRSKTGKEKKQRQIYLVDAVSVTDAEVKVVKNYEDAKSMIEFRVNVAKESRIIDVI
jgi:hypothetical protein